MVRWCGAVVEIFRMIDVVGLALGRDAEHGQICGPMPVSVCRGDRSPRLPSSHDEAERFSLMVFTWRRSSTLSGGAQKSCHRGPAAFAITDPRGNLLSVGRIPLDSAADPPFSREQTFSASSAFMSAMLSSFQGRLAGPCSWSAIVPAAGRGRKLGGVMRRGTAPEGAYSLANNRRFTSGGGAVRERRRWFWHGGLGGKRQVDDVRARLSQDARRQVVRRIEGHAGERRRPLPRSPAGKLARWV